MSIKQIFFPVPTAFMAFTALVLLLQACPPQEQVVLEQQERTKVSIAGQNEHIQGLRDAIETARKNLEIAENVIIFCWDEKVVDLSNKKVCKIAAGGFFTPENENNGQVSGPYVIPANAVLSEGYCAATRVSIPKDRFLGMSHHFSQGCQLIWDEQNRRRKIAEDVPSKKSVAPVNDPPVQ